MKARPTSLRVFGTSRPHLQLVKPRYSHPHRRPAGGRRVLGVDPAVEAGAACAEVDTELFFSEGAEEVAAARRLCAGCPVRVACLERALANEESFGVFGGLTPAERRKLRQRRKRQRGEAA